MNARARRAVLSARGARVPLCARAIRRPPAVKPPFATKSARPTTLTMLVSFGNKKKHILEI